ncbi:hypothetical protein BU14_0032s0074 [Porphyra umbilicalis]|uniref:Uncharacterized protein n=1 Tax=Porphyra umbilicalis TaxID=2786 RepID=A0A1X6PJ94_PORUM|nr:hypothetical protein BU14_0032s0074 [Porphyra umbilicalis]|eukprot:OSX80816.1 hypothetical protein BU14_0032s0074 [Porphyra umbilicalis]
MIGGATGPRHAHPTNASRRRESLGAPPSALRLDPLAATHRWSSLESGG